MDLGSVSNPVITVAPVVVKPDMDSNTASVIDITGVADSRPWLDVFDTVLERTAKRDGVSKTQALRDFIRGDNNLWQLAAAVGIGGGMAGGTSDAEAEESAGRLAPGAELVN